jgi:DNA polymerase-3 subunit delta
VDIISLLRNGSLFARHKVVCLFDADQIKRKEDVSLLEEYIHHPSPDSTLLLVSDTSNLGSVSKKITNALPKQARQIFWEMFQNRKVGWVKKTFERKDIHIDTEAATFLLEMIENNTRDLEQECERLALFFGPGTVLHTETIAQYIYHSKEENVFTLFEKLAERDLAASEEVLCKILLSKESDPSALMGGLLWQIRKLIDLKRLLEENYSEEEAFSRIAIKGKKRRGVYIAAHKAYSLAEAQTLISLVAEFDVRLRSYKAEVHAVLLQLFLYYAIVRGGRMPRWP